MVTLWHQWSLCKSADFCAKTTRDCSFNSKTNSWPSWRGCPGHRCPVSPLYHCQVLEGYTRQVIKISMKPQLRTNLKFRKTKKLQHKRPRNPFKQENNKIQHLIHTQLHSGVLMIEYDWHLVFQLIINRIHQDQTNFLQSFDWSSHNRLLLGFQLVMRKYNTQTQSLNFGQIKMLVKSWKFQKQ